MVFNATFNNISAILLWSVLLLEETGVPASYQVSVHLAKRFQRRRLKCEQLTDDRRYGMAKVHIANVS